MFHLLLAIIYLAYISLGLPDSLLGASWPMMYESMGVSVSYAGIISVIISFGTVVSSLLSNRITSKFSPGLVASVSTAITALALLGFSVSKSFWMLCLFAIPYGLGAGCVDATLNNYVAVHYASRHMSWLHCMWGLGASIGPYIISICLSAGGSWPSGYQSIGTIQVIIAVLLFFALPLWRKSAKTTCETPSTPLSIRQILNIPGAKYLFIAFFCYCGAECTLFLWTSTYFVLHHGITEEAAAVYASLFYLGMTGGRALNGFLTIRWKDSTLIKLGSAIMVLGMCMLLIPAGQIFPMIAVILIGIGCAPIYPCIIHSTPETFGQEHSQGIIGVQMASAYLGGLLMPPIFGLIVRHISASMFPFYLLLLAALMILSYRMLLKSKRA